MNTLDSIFLEIASNSETKTLSEVSYLIPTTNSVEEPKKSSHEFVYSRDQLLALRPAFSLPIEGLIPEVLPGFVDPNEEAPSSPSDISTFTPPAKFSRTPRSDSKGNANASPALSKYAKNSTPVSSEEKTFSRALTIELPSTPTTSATTLKTPVKSPKGDLVDILEESLLTPTSKAEWRLKKKKEKARETDPKRLIARQKQLDIGK